MNPGDIVFLLLICLGLLTIILLIADKKKEEGDSSGKMETREKHLQDIVSTSRYMEEKGGKFLLLFVFGIILFFLGIGITEDGGSAGEFCSTIGAILILTSLAFGLQFLSQTNKGVSIFYFQEEREKAQTELDSYNHNQLVLRRKQWLEKVTITILFQELDKYIENLRETYSTKNEQIVVGHKTVNEGSIFQHEVEQYATRSRDIPEHRIEKMVLDSYPSDIELELVRRGKGQGFQSPNEVLDELIGKYSSGENLEITKRILRKLSPEIVGGKFEEYGMLEEAENWYASNKLLNDAKRLREKMRFKLDQTVVHGDYVDDRDTIIKDSVLNRSNVGGGSSKAEELREAKSLLDEGLINENDYEKMKKEILGNE